MTIASSRVRLHLAVVALLLFSSGLLRAHCLSGFSYTAPIAIANSGATTLTSYQTRLTINTGALVAAGRMRADGADIRFIDGTDCCVLLDYYIESGMNTPSTVIWVKVPRIDAHVGTTISIAYGNPVAVSNSSARSVFDIYDPA